MSNLKFSIHVIILLTISVASFPNLVGCRNIVSLVWAYAPHLCPVKAGRMLIIS